MADYDTVYRFLCEKKGKPRIVPNEWERMLCRLVEEGRARLVGWRRVAWGPRNSLRRMQRMAVAVEPCKRCGRYCEGGSNCPESM